MFKDILTEFKEKDYVYIINGCLNFYASRTPASNKACSICGEFEWDIASGFVKNLRKITNQEELDFYLNNGFIIENNQENLNLYRKKLINTLKNINNIIKSSSNADINNLNQYCDLFIDNNKKLSKNINPYK